MMSKELSGSGIDSASATIVWIFLFFLLKILRISGEISRAVTSAPFSTKRKVRRPVPAPTSRIFLPDKSPKSGRNWFCSKESK